MSREEDVEALAMALALDAEWRKQEADPEAYRFGKHVYPPKVLAKHIHALADEVARLSGELERLLAGIDAARRELARASDVRASRTGIIGNADLILAALSAGAEQKGKT